MIVHAQEKRRIHGRRLNGLAQDCGCAGLREKLQPARRLDADNSDHWRRREMRARLQQRRGIDRLISVEENDVAVGIEVRGFYQVDAPKRHAKPEKRSFEHVGVEVAAGPQQALATPKVLDQAIRRHDATRRTGRMATAPKRDELRMR